MFLEPLSRRNFLKVTSISGVTVAFLNPFRSLAQTTIEPPEAPSLDWRSTTGGARFRIDGIAKVTGGKVFARDIRAKNMNGWPQKQGHALVVRATFADREVLGLEMSLLGPDLAPDTLITAEDLLRDKLVLPKFYGDDMFVQFGTKPAYLGHAVAVLLYKDFTHFRLAKEKLQFNDKFIRYGAKAEPVERDPWGAFRAVRVGGAAPHEDDVFSNFQNTKANPIGYVKQQAIWPSPREDGLAAEQALFYADKIQAELNNPPKTWEVFQREYATPSTDTFALETDNANGWYDAEQQTLHFVVPTQSPDEIAQDVVKMLKASRFPLKKLYFYPCSTVGFGSKDHTIFPYYALISTLYGQGQPMRLANDRFEQFQTSLKRHAFDMKYQMAVDRQTHLIQSVAANFQANGGGRANLSAAVISTGSSSALAAYYTPKSDIVAVANASRAIDAGSARGFGTLQTITATELLMDEVAAELKLDPIEFRQKNVLKSGMKLGTGSIPVGAIRLDQILERAKGHPLWLERATKKIAYESTHPGELYGVGFACANKSFGSSSEAVFVKIEVNPAGEISLFHCGAEMGTGMSTSQALICADWLGQAATRVQTSMTNWDDLPIESPSEGPALNQAQQDEAARNPKWSPRYVSSSASSNSAYFFSKGTSEAARILFLHGLWPAALSIWGRGIGGGVAALSRLRAEDARWVEQGLTVESMPPLSLSTLAEHAHSLGLVTGVTCHAFSRWGWAHSVFEIDGAREHATLDGLSVRYGDGANKEKKSLATTPGNYHVLERLSVDYPSVDRSRGGPVFFSSMGTLVELAITKKSGEVKLLSHHSILDCGKTISPALVSSQIQGGVAMGIGFALLEYLPLYEDGPGRGDWTLGRYRLPRASDVCVWAQTSELLPPLSDTDQHKGIAEVVMIPVVSAIINGIAHATGLRFNNLPVTSEQLKERLA
jgi:CO/xanthine dehydrogenase Mo-binding subunit